MLERRTDLAVEARELWAQSAEKDVYKRQVYNQRG